MPEKESTERRNASRHLIENMLEERRQLLALMMNVSAISVAEMKTEDEELLEEFCQVLVDYIATGHFGLYERIAEGKERRANELNLAEKIYGKIDTSTQLALAFSERYKSENNSRTYNDFARDLSKLGESLTTRIEYEDRLIASMMD